MTHDHDHEHDVEALPPEGARFVFRSEEFEVEFRGAEEFVARQVDLVRDRIRRILVESGESATTTEAEEAEAEAADAAATTRSPLEEFYLKARTREGRGALQDSILIFAWYILEHQKKREFSIEDLNFCFDMLNIQRPKSLANTLGILKRDRNWLESASKRGTYTLTTAGRERARTLVD